MLALWPIRLQAQNGEAEVDDDAFDIGIIIDNRPSHKSKTARAEVEALFTMLDQQMFIEHIMIFERPTIGVICDVFGCPERIEPINPFPPLLWQITRADQARLVVYYIGEGRLEGIEQQLLFRRRDGVADHDVVALSVGWMHRALEDFSPKSAVLMLDAGFAPRRLPCANADPRLISDALRTVRRNYQQVARRHWNDIGENVELAATTPVQVSHCDRLDDMFSGIESPLFTHFLLKGIVDGEADDDEDLLVDLGELAGYLDERIGRTVRFQWGRRQNVRAIGARSKPLASVNKREMSDRNDAVLKRRQQPPQTDEASSETDEPSPKADEPPPETDKPSSKADESPPDANEPRPEADEPPPDDDVPKAPALGDVQQNERPTESRSDIEPTETERTVEPAGCDQDSQETDCHPCVLDPESAACADRCRAGQDSDLCAEGLVSGPDIETEEADVAVDEVDTAVIPIEEQSDSADGLDERSPVCGFATDNIAPFASALMDRIGGGTDESCAWALDRSEIELGPIGQIFTPVIWRLGRSYVQDGVSCLLACGRITGGETIGRPSGRAQVLSASLEAPREPAVIPQKSGPFKREACDAVQEPLPSYVGHSRGMVGTLTASEGQRFVDGCPSPVPSPSLPMPLVHALDVSALLKTAEAAADPALGMPRADGRLARWSPLAADANLPATVEVPKPASADLPVQRADATLPADDDRENEVEPSAEDTIVETVSQIRWLQSALTLENYNPGPIDGVMGEKTMAALRAWRRDKNRAGPHDAVTEAEFQEIIETFARRFGHFGSHVGSF